MKQNIVLNECFLLCAEQFQNIHVIKSPDKNIKCSTDNKKKCL